jgi:hypothetical protein
MKTAAVVAVIAALLLLAIIVVIVLLTWCRSLPKEEDIGVPRRPLGRRGIELLTKATNLSVRSKTR